MKGIKINIPSYVSEANYRYQMPRMDLRQESRGNGIKTNIYNLEDISKALRVPQEAIIRYMCAEIGASKEKKTIIKGHHTYDTLITCLDKFIEKYLLCRRCKYPETTMYITKQRQLMARCRACSTTNILDSLHKAGAYLIKDLPKNMDETDNAMPAGLEVPAGSRAEEDGAEEADEAGEGDHLAIDSEEIMEKLDKISKMA